MVGFTAVLGCASDGVVSVTAPRTRPSQHAMMQMDRKAENGAVNEAVEQVAYADRILLNKCDLVDDAQKAKVLSRCGNGSNPSFWVYRAGVPVVSREDTYSRGCAAQAAPRV